MRAIWHWFREAPISSSRLDAPIAEQKYIQYRNHVLYGSMVGYALFYFCRKNLSVALPLMSRDLGYSNTDLGVLGSTLYVVYGLSKFLSGVVADRANPRSFLVVGLVLSALVNFAFGFSSSLMVFIALWAVNGFFQSTGAPASAKMLATWFSAGERGTKTAIWNISHQGGGGLVLIVAGFLVAHYGWRGAFIGPALISFVGAFVVWKYLHDRPESLGLPPIEEFRGEPSVSDPEAETAPLAQLVFERVLANPRVWITAMASLSIYIVRYGALDWAPKYLFEVRHASIETAGMNASLLELIGIPGALVCGWASDKYFQARRAPVVIVSLVLLCLSTWCLYLVPEGHLWLDTVVLAAIGFFTYGPQMLMAGVAPVDASHKRVAAAAVGFVGLMSYVGATLSAGVTGWLLDRSGWPAAFAFWSAAAILGALFCIPLWRVSPTLSKSTT